MNYAAIKPFDIANGPGVRVSLFVSGCTHHCPGCFQPETWDFDYGEKFTFLTLQEIEYLLLPDYISGLTILGGEPFEPENLDELAFDLELIKPFLDGKTVWAYSGYTYEELLSRTGEVGKRTRRILNHLDVLVDGPFIEAQKDIGLVFRGSANQRIIDMPKTRAAGKIVLWEEDK